jgi:hypothetical protein
MKRGNLHPSACRTISMPLPPAPEIWNPVRKTVNIASPLACCRAFGGTLNSALPFPLVLVPELEDEDEDEDDLT